MSTELLYLDGVPAVRTLAGHRCGRWAGGARPHVFYPTGGGQPHDTGTLRWDGGEARWSTCASRAPTCGTRSRAGTPPIGHEVEGTIDWDRRHRADAHPHRPPRAVRRHLERVGVPVTGGNMEPLSARMDFELDPTPEGFGARVEELVAAEIAADRPIEVSSIPRAEAVLDEALIRTKVSLVPESVAEIRVVDIVGLDKQADGGTHVAPPARSAASAW